MTSYPEMILLPSPLHTRFYIERKCAEIIGLEFIAKPTTPDPVANPHEAICVGL